MGTSTLTTQKHRTNELAATRALVIDATWSVKSIANPAFGGCNAMYRFRPEETPPL